MLTRALALDGCRTLEAADGEDALEVLKSKAVDLLLLDLRMPRLDGFDALRILRKQASWRDLPVIVMSGSLPGPRIAVENGADDVATKPVAVKALLDKTWTLLERRGFIRRVAA
jgi:CheY-like chemotaxis protein